MTQTNVPGLTYSIYARWPTSICNACGWHGLASICFVSFMLFGLVPWAVFHYGFFNTFFPHDKQYDFMLITIYIACLWIWLGPMLIATWERNFHAFSSRVCQDMPPEQISEVAKYFKLYKFIAPIWGIFYVAVGLGLLFLFGRQIDILAPIFKDNVLLAATAVVILVSGYMTGYGVAGVIQTIWIFWNIKNINPRWVPFHYDGSGGFSFMGEFAIKTSLLFSGGIVVLPATIELSRQIGNYTAIAGYVMGALYCIFVSLIYIIPIWLTTSHAILHKEAHLGAIGDALGEAVHFEGHKLLGLREEPKQLMWLQVLFEVESKIRSVSIYPFSAQSVFKGIIASALPVMAAVGQGLLKFLAGL